MNMKQLRLRAGKKVEEIAVELDVAISTVRNWDQLKTIPRMTPMKLQQLMEVYRCTFIELVQAEAERDAVK
jgi:transcriptional regulator with XRE-family HTH domain